MTAFALAAGGCARIAKPQGWASPTLGDGVLFAAHRDRLFALDAATLAPRWAFPPSGGDDDIDPVALYGTPAVLGDTAFVPTFDGELYALDVETGETRWGPFEADGSLIGGVLASGDTVYFGSSEGKVYALDASTGEERWQPFKAGKGVWSTPAVEGDTLYVTSLDGRLYALDVAMGSERWSFKTGAGIGSPPVVDAAGGLVYVGGFDSRLRAIDVETHEERWSVKAGNWFWTEPLVSGGVLYAGGLDSKVYAVDVASGERRWSQPFSTKAPVHAAPVSVDGTLIIVDRDGHLYALDPATGAAKSQAPLVLGSDVLADALVLPTGDAGEAAVQLIVVTTGGELIRIDPATLEVVEQKNLKGE